MGYKNDLQYIEKRLNEILEEFQATNDKAQHRKLNEEARVLADARDAITKQIPIKPKLVYGERTNTHRLGRLVSLYCPVCDRFIVALYETDVERGGGLKQTVKGCSDCLQAIDFSGWYHKEPGDEEVVFDD